MKIHDILTEGARQRELERMMEPVERAYELKGINVTTKKTIREVRDIFPDEEGMVWYLRWIKIMKLNQLYESPSSTNREEIERIYRREIEKLERAIGRSVSDSELGGLYPYTANFEHFLSLPIPEIQDYDYRGKSIPEVLDDFRELEREWQEEREGQIHYDGEPVLIDFGDGFAWYDLEDAMCDAEGEAMGHCGNAPSSNPNETIFSLRKEIDREPDGTVILKPYLTFIFDKQTGMFGEMKGRGNQKPAERYHKYIIPLLEQNYVEGIMGGGYMPESNFKLTDLPDSEVNRLSGMKPRLLMISEYIEKFGVDDHVLDKIYVRRGILSINDDERTFETQIPIGYIEEHIRGDKNNVIGLMFEVSQGHKDFMDVMDFSQTPSEIIEENFDDNITIEQRKKIVDYLERNDIEWEEHPTIMSAIEDLDHGMYTEFKQAVITALEAGTESELMDIVRDAVINPREIEIEFESTERVSLPDYHVTYDSSNFTITYDIAEVISEIDDLEDLTDANGDLTLSHELEIILNPIDSRRLDYVEDFDQDVFKEFVDDAIGNLG